MKNNNTNLARKLRKNSTPTETMLWHALRSRLLNDLKFRRQYPIGKYVVDLYCPQIKLVIEIDGDVHAIEHQREYDSEREAFIRERGFTVFRVTNNEVHQNIQGILERILQISGRQNA